MIIAIYILVSIIFIISSISLFGCWISLVDIERKIDKLLKDKEIK